MDVAKVEKLAYLKMKDRKTKGREEGFIFYHGKRVGEIAKKIYNEVVYVKEQEEMDILYCGCLFHDIGKGMEPHNETGAEITRFYLRDLCTLSDLEVISNIVYEHNLRGEKYNSVSTLGKIAQDADILDHMGAMDIWIAIQWHGNFNEGVDISLDFYKGGKWEEIVLKLRGLLNFPCSIEAFDKRCNFTKEFIERLYRENAGELF